MDYIIAHQPSSNTIYVPYMFLNYLLGAALLAPRDLTPGGEAPPAIIDTVTAETDLSSLTPQQIYELNQNLIDEGASSRPLIAPPAPISVLRDEYESTSFTNQIDALRDQGYNGIVRARGDGDCFYRSLAFSYITNIMNSADPVMAAVTALSVLHESRGLLDHAGFQKMVYEDFYEILTSMIQEIAHPKTKEDIITTEVLLSAFQDPQVSNSIVVYLRLLASAQIRTDSATYDPFLIHPEANFPMEPHDFCVHFVEAVGREADHVQVAALSRALNLNVQVAYLDGRNAEGRIDFVPFANNDDHDTIKDIFLLYRPGHYDILETKEPLITPQESV